MKYLISKLLILLVLCSFAQTIPIDRTTNWSKAGYIDNGQNFDAVLDFVSEGGDPTGANSNDAVFEQIKFSYEGQSVQLNVPSGTYKFETSISFPSNFHLSGSCADSCKFIFDLNGNGSLMNISGELGTVNYTITENAAVGDSIIFLDQATELFLEDWLILTLDDNALVTSNWAERSVGQIVKVKSIDGNRITINSPLRIDFNTNNNIQADKLEMKENVVIENISIERIDETQNQTSNLLFSYATNCKVKCIESRFCNFSHITIEESSQVEVSGSYFNDAFDFGGGGKGYGIVLQFTSGDCLIHDNIFEKLRHAILLQAGPNGNVVSYNYSVDPFWTGTSLPSNAAGDIVLHGNYPFYNLFEGNICQQIVIDNSHGLNGTRNTFFRNRTELYGIFMNTDPPSDGQNFVGNEITNDGFLLGNYALQGKDHFEFGNNQRGTIIPSGTTEIPEASLYLNEIPTFYQENEHWPPIGPSNNLGDHINKAQSRFLQDRLTNCSQPTEPNAILNNFSDQISLFPNPTNSMLQINGEILPKEWIILDRSGTILFTGKGENIDMSGFVTGLYFIEIQVDKNTVYRSKILKY